jgi:hypothetical protein
MKRLFGGKKEVKESPSLNDATDTTNKRVEVLDVKIKNCEKELLDYKGKLKAARPGPAQANLKKRALAVLNQKRMYERQRDQVMALPYLHSDFPRPAASRRSFFFAVPFAWIFRLLSTTRLTLPHPSR